MDREASKAQTLINSTNKTVPEQVQKTQEILCEQKDTFVSDMLTAGLLLVLWRDVSKTTPGGVYRQNLSSCEDIDKVFLELSDKLEATLGGGLNVLQAAMYDLGTGSPPFVPAQTVLKQHVSVKQTSTTECSQEVDVHQTAHVPPSMEVEQSASVSQESTSEHGTSQQASAGDASGEQTVGVNQQVVEDEQAHTSQSVDVDQSRGVHSTQAITVTQARQDHDQESVVNACMSEPYASMERGRVLPGFSQEVDMHQTAHVSVKQTSTTECSQEVDVHQTAHVPPSMEVEQSASVSQESTSEHGTSQQASAGDASGEQTVGVNQQVVEDEQAHTSQSVDVDQSRGVHSTQAITVTQARQDHDQESVVNACMSEPYASMEGGRVFQQEEVQQEQQQHAGFSEGSDASTHTRSAEGDLSGFETEDNATHGENGVLHYASHCAPGSLEILYAGDPHMLALLQGNPHNAPVNAVNPHMQQEEEQQEEQQQEEEQQEEQQQEEQQQEEEQQEEQQQEEQQQEESSKRRSSKRRSSKRRSSKRRSSKRRSSKRSSSKRGSRKRAQPTSEEPVPNQAAHSVATSKGGAV